MRVHVLITSSSYLYRISEIVGQLGCSYSSGLWRVVWWCLGAWSGRRCVGAGWLNQAGRWIWWVGRRRWNLFRGWGLGRRLWLCRFGFCQGRLWDCRSVVWLSWFRKLAWVDVELFWTWSPGLYRKAVFLRIGRMLTLSFLLLWCCCHSCYFAKIIDLTMLCSLSLGHKPIQLVSYHNSSRTIN